MHYCNLPFSIIVGMVVPLQIQQSPFTSLGNIAMLWNSTRLNFLLLIVVFRKTFQELLQTYFRTIITVQFTVRLDAAMSSLKSKSQTTKTPKKKLKTDLPARG